MRRRTAVAAVLAVGVTVGPGLTACGSSQSSAGGKPTLTWYINPDGGGSDPTKKGQAQIAKECTDAAGGRYAIRVQLLPNSASDQREQLLRRLAAKDSSIDLMSIDPVFVAEFAEAGFLAPVPQDVVAGFTEDMVKAPRCEAATWKGQLVAVPFWANTQLLWYRKSVAKAAGLDMTKPVTWDQLIKAARGAEEDDRRPGQPLRGLRGVDQRPHRRRRRPDLSRTRGHRRPAQARPGDARRQGRREVIQQVGPDRCRRDRRSRPTTETEALYLFSSSASSGFMVNWPYTWAALPTNGVKFIDDIGWARYPETVAGKPVQPRRSAGSTWASARSASTPTWRTTLAKCITSPEHQRCTCSTPATRRPTDASTTTRRSARQLPMAALIRQSLGGRRAAAADAVLRRRLHRSAARVQPAGLGEPAQHAREPPPT